MRRENTFNNNELTANGLRPRLIYGRVINAIRNRVIANNDIDSGLTNRQLGQEVSNGYAGFSAVRFVGLDGKIESLAQ